MDELIINVEESTNRWTGQLGDEVVAAFGYVSDSSGRMWLCEATTVGRLRRKGIGSRMVAAAVEYYGEVWASTASKMEEDEDDTRHLSDESAALVSACIRKGILKREWVRNPYLEVGHDDDDPER